MSNTPTVTVSFAAESHSASHPRAESLTGEQKSPPKLNKKKKKINQNRLIRDFPLLFKSQHSLLWLVAAITQRKSHSLPHRQPPLSFTPH